MSYTGGIDSQLRDTQDGIMSGTRQPLDNRLLDVLALQRIKEAQAKAKQKLLTSMEGKEGTVADQLTNEVINNEKEKLQGGIKDIAAQVGATNTQQAQQQQQNLQRVAQQGVATQPAPNMARMAGGGIVTFAGPDGSAVNTQNLTEEQIQFLRSKGLNDAQIASMTPDKLRAAMSAVPSRSSGLLNRIREGVDFKVPPRRPAGYGYNPLDYASELGGVPEGYEEKIRRANLAHQKRNALQEARSVGRAQDSLRQRYIASPAGQQTMPLAAEDIGPLGSEDFRGDIAKKAQADAINRKQAIVGTLTPSSPQPGTRPAAPLGPQPAGGNAELNAGIPTAVPPPSIAPGTGQITDMDNFGLPGQKRREIGFERRPEMAGVTQKQNELREYLKGIRGQDVGAAKKKALSEADEYTNRAGIANQYKNMLARRQEADRVSGEERDYWALNDMLARAGGQGALSNIARGAADMRTAKREDILRRHDKREALERAGIDTDTKLAIPGLQSGDKAAELTSNEKKAAATAESNLLANQASNLTEEAKAMLQGDMANLTAESKAFDRRLSLMTANASNEVKVAVANLNGKLKSEANEIAKMAISAKSVSDFNVVLARINEAMGKIRVTVADNLVKVTTSNPIYLAMQQDDPKKAAEYLENMQSRYQDIAEDSVRELTAQRAIVTKSLASAKVDMSKYKRPSSY